MEAPGEALRADVLSAASAAWTDLEWMERQLLARFDQDAAGRIPSATGVSVELAPRFYLGLTRHGNLWRFRSDLARETVIELARLAGREPAARSLDELPERAAAMRARLQADAAIEQEQFVAAFRFPDSLPEPTGCARIDAEETPGEAPAWAAFEGDRRIAVSFTGLRGGGLAGPGVETLPGFRRQGFASRALSAWARAVRADGEQPFFTAPVSDRAARGLARRLGLIRFGSALLMR